VASKKSVRSGELVSLLLLLFFLYTKISRSSVSAMVDKAHIKNQFHVVPVPSSVHSQFLLAATCVVSRIFFLEAMGLPSLLYIYLYIASTGESRLSHRQYMILMCTIDFGPDSSLSPYSRLVSLLKE
jgi:hypothetical protein